MADHRQLRPMLLEAGKGVFAVIDGAQFDDLPVALFGRHFVHTPLYTNRGNLTPDQVKTAPQLVWLDRDRKSEHYEPSAENFPIEEQVLDRLFDLVEERPAVVFWQCEAGAEVLYRHLRTINMVLYPTAAGKSELKDYERSPYAAAAKDSEDYDDLDFDRVIFRHADANVMAQIVPCVTAKTYARLLGPANWSVFVPDDDWSETAVFLGPRSTLSPSDPGPLALQLAEVNAIEAFRQDKAWFRRVRYLRETTPDETKTASDGELLDYIKVCTDLGHQIGLKSEGAQCRWSYLMLVTRGAIARSNDVVSYIRQGGSSPDEQIQLLFKSTIQSLRAQRAYLGLNA